MTSKEKYALLDKLGLCYECHKAKQFGKWKYCPECLEKIAARNARKWAQSIPEERKKATEKAKARRHKRKEEGLCPLCGKPATHGIYCYEHSIKEKRHHQELAAKAKQARHDRGLIPDYRKANRLCLQCGAPIEDGNDTMYCNFHREKMVEYNRMADSTLWKSFRFGRLLYEPTYQSGQAGARAGGV